MAEAGERPASVKMTMDLTEYLVSLKRMQAENKRTADEGKQKFASMAKGLDAAKRSMGELAGSVKQGLRTIVTLGGAASLAGGIKGAVELNARYRQLAFGASTATGSLIDQNVVQEMVERSAAKSSRTHEELTKVFEDLNDATGDFDFSGDVLETIGKAATATGTPLEALTTLADQLHTKFGIAAESMQDEFAAVYEASRKGGPSMSEFADVSASVGAELLAAGFEGKRGLDFMLGALVATDDKLESLPAQVKGLKAVLRGLGDKGELKAIAKGLGIDAGQLINEKDATARLNKIFSHGKAGVKALMGAMNEGEEKETLKILFTDPFEKALADANASGLKGKAAIDAALKVLDDGIASMGKAHMTGADLERRAAEEMKSPAAQLRNALNELNKSFEKPEIIKAINDLSHLLPKLAEVIGSVVSFAAAHPLLATAGYGAAKVGGSFAGAAAREAASQIYEAHKKGGMEAARSMLGSMTPGLPAAGGALGLAAKASMIASAGAIGFAIGDAIAPYIIDPLVDADLKKTRDVEGGSEAAIADAAGGGSATVLQGRLDRLVAALETEKGAKLGSGFMDSAISTFGGPDVAGMSKDRIARGEEAASDLRQRIREQKAAGDPLRGGGGGTVNMEADTIRGKVELGAGAPRQIAGALVTGLSGKVINVRLVSGSGIVAQGRPSGGGRGPQQMPPPRASGGV